MQKTSLTIRPAEKEDLIKILQVQKSAFFVYTDIFSKEQIPPLSETIEEVTKDSTEKSIFVAVMKKKVVGSVRFKIRAGVCLLEKLSVDPECQKSGVGTALVKKVEEAIFQSAHKIYLETGLRANYLIKFYSNLGYSGEAILKKHYGEFDWIIFSKFLNK